MLSGLFFEQRAITFIGSLFIIFVFHMVNLTMACFAFLYADNFPLPANVKKTAVLLPFFCVN